MSRIINNFSKKEIRKDLRKNQTPEEKLLWLKIRNNQTGYKWRRQISIGNYIADFYCREKLIAIELDGNQHRENKEYDKERDKFFAFLRIETLRFWNSEVNGNLNGVLEEVLKKLNSKTSPQPSPGKERVNPFAFQEKG